jgi:hypothetical protein
MDLHGFEGTLHRRGPVSPMAPSPFGHSHQFDSKDRRSNLTSYVRTSTSGRFLTA